MTATIYLERMMHRDIISVPGASAASYVLVKLIPSGAGEATPPLHIALVLDVSGSMYEEDGTGQSRLQRIQKAALAALDRLRPQDTLTVIAFARNAAILLPATPLTQRAAIVETLDKIDRCDIDPGGTAMDEAMRCAYDELRAHRAADRLSQMLVLTDGETSGEVACRELASQMGQEKIRLTVMGVGTEWNASLIKDLARLAQGTWYYIDAEDAQSAERAFDAEFQHLAALLFSGVKVHLWPVRDVRVKRFRQVTPEIRTLDIVETEERHWVAAIGNLEKDRPARFVVELSLPARPDGQYVVAQLGLEYELAGQVEKSALVPLLVTYRAAGPGPINAEVARYIDEIQMYEMNEQMQQAIASGDTAKVQQVAEKIVKKGEGLGPRAAKKTMLARQALGELGQTGRVSRKTQLALEDSARLAEEMPLPG